MTWDNGFLVIDKPPGVTSHDVVAIVRATTGIKKVGHTGTLDPFATGVLPLALGSATRLIQHLDENEKVYDAQILLGRATDTGDPTGQTVAEAPVPPITRAQVEAVLATFPGVRMQTPPRYSAVKVAGRPLYDYARKGQAVEVKARPVRIDGMELVSMEGPRIRVIIRCSRGTYARVLAEEIAAGLGTVGHLDELRRLGSGRFRIEDALSFSQLAEIVAGDPTWDRVLRPGRGEARVPWRNREAVFEGLARYVVTARDALTHLPAVVLSPLDARRYVQGGVVPPPPVPGASSWVLLSGGEVLGVGSAAKPEGTRLDDGGDRGRPGPHRGSGPRGPRPERAPRREDAPSDRPVASASGGGPADGPAGAPDCGPAAGSDGGASEGGEARAPRPVRPRSTGEGGVAVVRRRGPGPSNH